MEKMKLHLIDSDLLNTGCLQGMILCTTSERSILF
jgi:hypothetical protein